MSWRNVQGTYFDRGAVCYQGDRSAGSPLTSVWLRCDNACGVYAVVLSRVYVYSGTSISNFSLAAPPYRVPECTDGLLAVGWDFLFALDTTQQAWSTTVPWTLCSIFSIGLLQITAHYVKLILLYTTLVRQAASLLRRRARVVALPAKQWRYTISQSRMRI